MVNSTDDDDIKKLFENVAGHFAGADEGARGMFGMLVGVALRYRDTLLRSTGRALTVEETRDALSAFMEVLKTRRIPPARPKSPLRRDEGPQSLDKRVHDLVILWLDELKTRVHH